MSKSKLDLSAYLLILVYFVWLSLFAFYYYSLGQAGSPDNDFYGWYAPDTKKILEGKILDIEHYEYKGVGYNLLLALAGLFKADLFRAGVVVSNVSSLVGLWAIYTFFSAIFNRPIALITLLGTMANHAFITYGYSICPDMAFTTFVFLSLAFLMVKGPSNRLGLALSGCFAGYAYITKYNALFLLLPLAYLILNSRGKKIQSLLIYLFSFSLLALPWHVLLYYITGNPFYHRQYINLAYDLLHIQNVSKDFFFQYLDDNYHSVWQVISSDPTGFLAGFVSNFTGHFSSQLNHLMDHFPKPLIVLGLVLYLGHLYCRPDRKQIFWFGCGLSYYFLMLFIHYEDRYSLFLVPFYSFFAFFPLVGPFWQKVKNRTVLLCRIGFSIILVIFIFSQGVKANLKRVSKLPTEIFSFADYLSFFAQEGEVIMARAPHLAYYAGIEYRIMPYTKTISELVEYAQKKGIRYLYFSYLETRYRPWLSNLENVGQHHPNLLPIMDWKHHGRRAVLYTLVDSKLAYQPFSANIGSFSTSPVYSSPNQSYTLHGLLKAPQSGEYSVVFSGSRYRIEIDGEDVLSTNLSSRSSYQKQKVYLVKGFHSLKIRLHLSQKDTFPLGLFWEIPSGEKGPIPKESLIFFKQE